MSDLTETDDEAAGMGCPRCAIPGCPGGAMAHAARRVVNGFIHFDVPPLPTKGGAA